MTILKPADKLLVVSDLEANLQILPDDKINISYADPATPDLAIGFVTGDKNYFFNEMIPWLNENNYSALIWIESEEIAKIRGHDLPEPIGPKLCFSYEGFFTQNLTHKLLEVGKCFEENLDKFLSPAILWVLENLTKEKNILIFMNSAGQFKRFGNFSWYWETLEKGIVYCVYGKMSNSDFYKKENFRGNAANPQLAAVGVETENWSTYDCDGWE